MTKTRHSRLLQFTGLLLSALVWLANNANPPTGKTGAPFTSEGTCAESNCHGTANTNNYDGEVTVDGLPGTIEANTVYPLSITLTPTAGSPTKGGFQLVVVDGNDVNAGDLTAGNAQSGTEFFLGREYLEHRNGKTFVGGGPATWNFNWKSPINGVSGNTIKFYFIGNFTNNNGQITGDFPKAGFSQYGFNGPLAVTATITNSTNVLCNGGNTGSATAEGGGGVAPYTYLWSNFQTTPTINNLAAGTYTVTVTGSSSSGTATASVQITQPPVLTVSLSPPGLLTCSESNATSTATVSGGTPGYDVNWSNGQSGNTATFSAPGTYSVTATDANGCTKVGTVNVNQNTTSPTATVAQGGTLDCIVTQTMLNGVGSSQGPNFTYMWTTAGGNIVSGGTTLVPTVNGCGPYILTVTNNSNGCTATASTTVTCQINPPDISASNTGPLTCTVLTVTLNGNSATNGVTYSWTGPNGFTSTEQSPTTNTLGVYTLVVTNPANGCTSSLTTAVSQNIAVPTDTTQVSGVLNCVTDSVAIFMTTNIQNATYLWSGPNGFASTQKRDTIAVPGNYIGVLTNPVNGCKSRDTITVVLDTLPPGATAMASGTITCINTSATLMGGPSGGYTYAWTGPNNFTSTLQNPTANAAGTYNLVVTSDTTGCTSTASATIQQNITAPTAIIAPPGSLNCSNATITLNASGSSQGANFTYSWTTLDGNFVSGETTLTPTVNAPGTYKLLVTNTNNGCTSTISAVVIQRAPVLASISSSTNVSCNGGSNGAATVLVSGGNGTYTYLWSNSATTATISGLSAGSYNVTVKDGENCTATATVVITQPNPLIANATATGETSLGANDGMATAAPTGGVPAYVYSWSNSGTTATITGLMPGSYTVTVGDANGCTVVQSVTVNSFGCSLSGSLSATNVTCNGANNGIATVNLIGAADPVTFAWSNGETTQTVSNLSPGTYTVSVIDGNNCPAVLNATITQPTAISANASATNETSTGGNNGTATANPTGGTGSYTYLWSNSGTTATITGLMPGAYTVSVTDANNCTATQTVNVASFNCSVSVAISSANASCFGLNDGLATAIMSGGQSPYAYVWSSGATMATATNLVAGTYTVTATDDLGCSTTENVTITEPTVLTAQVTNIQNVVCPSAHTGAVSIMADGGTLPYTFTGNLNNLGVGLHTVEVTDANGCTITVTFSIIATDNQPPVLNCPANIIFCGADIVTYPAPTATDNCGALQNPPVLISGQPSGSAFNDGTTVQVFRATDASGNTGTCSFSVIVYPVPDILINGSTDDHNGQGVGTISITPVGGNGVYQFSWYKNGQLFSNDEDLTGLTAGTYSLVVTDGNGCSTSLAPISIQNTVGTNELEKSGSIRLYPNPAATTIQLVIIDLDVLAATILDIRGQVVYELQPLEWKGEVAVDNLSTGVYFLRLATDNGKVFVLKFIKAE